MQDTVILAMCGLNLAAMAAWITVGALENLFHPSLNEPYTSEVMDMKAMRDEYPEAYPLVAYRRLKSRKLRQVLFGVIVGFELLAMVILWTAFGATVLAVFGGITPQTAVILGLIGAGAFTAIWAGFLVVGNYFCYWFGYEGAQNTHFQMLQWGLLGMIFMLAANIALSGA